MAVVITPSNSRTTQYSSTSAYLVFLMTEGSYVTEENSNASAVLLTGGHVTATIKGAVISAAGSGLRVGVFEGGDALGHNSVIVSASGTVQGSAASPPMPATMRSSTTVRSWGPAITVRASCWRAAATGWSMAGRSAAITA